MKKINSKIPKISLKKLHAQTITYEEFHSRLTAKQQKIVERNAKYYIMLRDLRRERKAKGLTQQQLAIKVHMPRTMITKIESGSRNVTLDTLMQIAQAMGKSLTVGLE